MVLLILMGIVYKSPCCTVRRDNEYIEIQNIYVLIIIQYIMILIHLYT